WFVDLDLERGWEDPFIQIAFAAFTMVFAILTYIGGDPVIIGGIQMLFMLIFIATMMNGVLLRLQQLLEPKKRLHIEMAAEFWLNIVLADAFAVQYWFMHGLLDATGFTPINVAIQVLMLVADALPLFLAVTALTMGKRRRRTQSFCS
ncbi:MAG TPA: hypothetical protein VN495_01960, partial [Candidatus Paceibacterota bacterium]|nr:hypothetical protein [Candidatus Paceibacterota bacterium]